MEGSNESDPNHLVLRRLNENVDVISSGGLFSERQYEIRLRLQATRPHWADVFALIMQ